MKWTFALLAAAALCAIPRPGDAQQYQPASISAIELLARVDKAFGTMAPGAYYSVNRIVASDGIVTTTETYEKGHDFKSVRISSGFQNAWGKFQGHSWSQDTNGFVRPTSDDEPPDPFNYARDHPGDPSSGVVLLGLTGVPAQFVVQIDPRKGLHQLRYYDAQTYLLTRTETTDYDGHTRVAAYGNYKRVGGEFIALTTTYSDDLSSRTSRGEYTTYESIPASEAILDVPASKPLFDLGSRSSVTIPAKFVKGEIVVSVTISGTAYDFMLDSGASAIVFDSAAARASNLSIIAPQRVSFGGDFTIGTARIPDLAIGDLHAANVAVDVAPHRDGSVVGLLGCDFIASGALLVDYANQTVTLHASAPEDPPADGWIGIPIALNSCVPQVHATFDGTPGNFVIDLGATTTFLSRHYFDRLAIPETSTRTTKGFFIGGKGVDVLTYIIDEMHLGDLAYQNVFATVPSTTIADTRGFDGLIGRTFLRHFNLLFDYAHQKVYFKEIADTPH